MDKTPHIRLFYNSKSRGHVKDSLYHMMSGTHLRDQSNNKWEIKREELHEKGFQLVHDAVRAGSVISCVAIFHHHPSGSTILIKDGYSRPETKIYGEKREDARSVLTELVRPYGFELKEVK